MGEATTRPIRLEARDNFVSFGNLHMLASLLANVSLRIVKLGREIHTLQTFMAVVFIDEYII